VTQAQRRRLEEWFAAKRAAGRLRTQSVFGAAGAASAALGFVVTSEQAGQAWRAAMRRKDASDGG